MDGNGDVAEGLYEQAKCAFENLVSQMSAAGATVENLVKTTVFVVDLSPEKIGAIAKAQAQVFGDHVTASSWVGASGLSHATLLIEIEGVAVLADD